jgi:succinoglycan biosynthesis protein ExoM
VPATPEERPRSVAICALTLDRPVGLARLLSGVSELEPRPDAAVTIVIVDSDPEGSAEPVVGQAPLDPSVARDLRPRPRRGIPFARNRARRRPGRPSYTSGCE